MYNGGLFSSGVPSFNRDPTGSGGRMSDRSRLRRALPYAVAVKRIPRAPHRPLPGRAQSPRPLPGPGHRPAGPRPGREDAGPGVHRLQVPGSPPPRFDLRGAAGVQAEGRRRGPDDPDRKEEGTYIPLGKAKPGRGRAADVGRREPARCTCPTTRPSARPAAPTTRPTRSSSTSSSPDGRAGAGRKARTAAARVPQGPQDLRPPAGQCPRSAHPLAGQPAARRAGAKQPTRPTPSIAAWSTSCSTSACSTRRWAAATSWSRRSTSSPTG